jgi:agmatinase
MSTKKNPHFLASEFPNAAASKAAFHVIPVPMELSVSYGSGTADGPLALLSASSQLEDHDRGVSPGRKGIHTQSVLSLPRGATAEDWLSAIRAGVARALATGAKPLLIGGEHTVTLGAARALAAQKREIGFVHIDAHCDLRDSYEDSPLSHACVMRRIAELGFSVAQFGTRAYSLEELAYRRKNRRISGLDAEKLTKANLPRRLLPAQFPSKIYISFDLDGLDPSCMPATGTPVAGGLGWQRAMDLLDSLVQGRAVIGADVVELSPIEGLHFADFTAAQVAHRLLALMS